MALKAKSAATNADKQVKLKPLSSMERVRLAYGGPAVHVRCKAAGRRRPRPALQALCAQSDANALLTSQSCGALPPEAHDESCVRTHANKTTSSHTRVGHCHKTHLKQQQQQHLAAPTDDTGSLSSKQSYTNSSVHTRRRKRCGLAIRRSDIYGIVLQPPRRYSWLLSPVRGARAVNVAPTDSENTAASNTSCSAPTSPVVHTKAVRVKARSAKQSDGVATTRVVSSDSTADQQPSVMQHQQHAVVAAGTTPVAAATGNRKSALKSSQEKRGKDEQHASDSSASNANEVADCEINTPSDDAVSTESVSVLQDSIVTATIEVVTDTNTDAVADVDTYSDADESFETDDQNECDIVQTSDTILVAASIESVAANHKTVQTVITDNATAVEQVQRAIADDNAVLPQSTNWWDNVAAIACTPKAQSISVDKATDSAVTTVSATEENWWSAIVKTTVPAQRVASSSTQQNSDQQQQQQSNWWDNVAAAAAVTATAGGPSCSISDRWSISSDIGSVQSNWLGALKSSMRTTVATASEVPYAIATTFPKVMLIKRHTESTAIASDVVTTAASAVAA
jgi:hypothetical protein